MMMIIQTISPMARMKNMPANTEAIMMALLSVCICVFDACIMPLTALAPQNGALVCGTVRPQ